MQAGAAGASAEEGIKKVAANSPKVSTSKPDSTPSSCSVPLQLPCRLLHAGSGN